MKARYACRNLTGITANITAVSHGVGGLLRSYSRNFQHKPTLYPTLLSSLNANQPNPIQPDPRQVKPTQAYPTQPNPHTQPYGTPPSSPRGGGATQLNATQPYPTQPNPTLPYPTAPPPTPPQGGCNPTQPNPTQPNPTEPNQTQPNPTQPYPTLPYHAQPNPLAVPLQRQSHILGMNFKKRLIYLEVSLWLPSFFVVYVPLLVLCNFAIKPKPDLLLVLLCSTSYFSILWYRTVVTS